MQKLKWYIFNVFTGLSIFLNVLLGGDHTMTIWENIRNKFNALIS